MPEVEASEEESKAMKEIRDEIDLMKKNQAEMKKNQHEEMVEAREGLARWLSKNRLLHHERTILEIAGQ